MGELEHKLQDRTKQLAQYSASDPQRYEALSEALQSCCCTGTQIQPQQAVTCAEEAHVVAKSAVNRWTDNLETLHDYLKGQMAGAEDQVKQLFSQVRASAEVLCMHGTRLTWAAAARCTQPGVSGVNKCGPTSIQTALQKADESRWRGKFSFAGSSGLALINSVCT